MSVAIRRVIRAHAVPGAVVLAAVIVVAFAGCAVDNGKSGASVANEIKAHAFVLVDESGRKRAELSMTEDGETRLRMCSPDGMRLVWIRIDESGLPGIALLNSDQEPVVELGMFNDSEPFLVLRDKKGTARIGAKVTESNGIALSLYDSKEAVRSRLAVGENGLPRLELCDQTGLRATAEIYEDGQCAFDLYDSKQKLRVGTFSLAAADDLAGLAVLSDNGDIVASVHNKPLEDAKERLRRKPAAAEGN